MDTFAFVKIEEVGFNWSEGGSGIGDINGARC